jgi:hypothetical protein
VLSPNPVLPPVSLSILQNSLDPSNTKLLHEHTGCFRVSLKPLQGWIYISSSCEIHYHIMGKQI